MKWLSKFSAVVLMVAAAQLGAQTYHQLESAVTLKGASPEWDYVTLDVSRGRLFIGRREQGAAVFDLKTRKVVKVIDKSETANGVVLVPEFDLGYTANDDGTVTQFRLSSLETLDRIKAGKAVDYGFYDPVTKLISLNLNDEKAIGFLDARTGKMLGTLTVDSNKLDASAPDGLGHMLVAVRDRDKVIRVNLQSRKIVQEMKIEGANQPAGLAYDAAHNRIFVACRGKEPFLVVLDGDSGKTVAKEPIGRGNDGVVFDSQTGLIYTTNGVDGNLVIYKQVDPDHYRLMEATTTRPYARTLALDPKTKKVYTVTAEGSVDPSKKINTSVATFYPNFYYGDTFTVLTYAPRPMKGAAE